MYSEVLAKYATKKSYKRYNISAKKHLPFPNVIKPNTINLTI